MEDNWYKYGYNGQKLIDIIRGKNINLHGLHFNFSTVEWLIWKYIYFLDFLELFFNGER
jgi:hypothetical protein